MSRCDLFKQHQRCPPRIRRLRNLAYTQRVLVQNHIAILKSEKTTHTVAAWCEFCTLFEISRDEKKKGIVTPTSSRPSDTTSVNGVLTIVPIKVAMVNYFS